MSRLPWIPLFLLLLSGCASLIGSATSRMAEDITLAILNQDDPATVRDGAPAYLLMIDGLIEGDPDNTGLLLAGARLYGSYAGAFAEDEDRARRLSQKALHYARRALCEEDAALCAASDARLEPFNQALAKSARSDLAAIYAFGMAWATWVQANADDWSAVADLAKIEALFERCLVIDETHDGGGAHVYLGVIKSLRPAALGGKPESARGHFERAIEISAGKNLMVKVLMAKHYARNVFDQELHDRLLTSVGSADAEYPGYTLINSLAKAEAEVLLAESKDFF